MRILNNKNQSNCAHYKSNQICTLQNSTYLLYLVTLKVNCKFQGYFQFQGQFNIMIVFSYCCPQKYIFVRHGDDPLLLKKRKVANYYLA